MNIQRFLIGVLAAVLIMVSWSDSSHAAEPKIIVVYGASGKIGAKIAAEALDRGYRVKGVSRDPAKSTIEHERFTAEKGDVTDAGSVQAIAAGATAIVVSVSGNMADNKPENATTNRAAQAMVKALSPMGDAAPRVIQIGGATAMHDSKEDMLKHMPFPAAEGTARYAGIFGHAEALKTYRASSIKWTQLNPAEQILGMGRGADRRTGQYRTSTAAHLRDARGESTITLSDLAVAAVDEIDNGRFIRQKFTIGY